MKYHSLQHCNWNPSHHTKPKSKSGLVLISILVIMAVISLFLLQWYQNEIQYRLQAQVALKHHSLFQELEGVLGQSIVSFQHYSELELRQNNVLIPHSELQPFFSNWVVQSTAAKEDSFLTLELAHQSSFQTQKFEALFYFSSYYLSDIPFLNLSQENSTSLPENLIFSSTDEQKLTINAPLFPLTVTELTDSFDHVFQGDTQIEWNADKITFLQLGKESTFLLNEIKNLTIQISGNTTITGDLTSPTNQQIFLKIIGNLNLKLPAKNAEFSKHSPNLFIHITENVTIQSSSLTYPTLQINAYFWIANGCLDIDSPIQTIHWKGSLACKIKSTRFNAPVYLFHWQSSLKPPISFARTFLQFNSIQPVDL